MQSCKLSKGSKACESKGSNRSDGNNGSDGKDGKDGRDGRDGSGNKWSRRIHTVYGRAADSNSPSDTWVCRLRLGTTFNGRSVSKMFLKIGLHPDCELTIKQESLGLLYEMRVSDQIITPLLDSVCPHFVRALFVSDNCTYAELFAALQKGLSRFRLTDPEIARCLARNFAHVAFELDGRPAIETPVAKSVLYEKVETSRFLLLATEFANAVKYRDWLASDPPKDAVFTVLLQLLIALYTMELCKLCHNDLHDGNIFVQKRKPTTIQYIINGQRFAIKTALNVMVYDFDRATSESLGENVHYTQNENYPPSPAFEANKDLAQFATYLDPLGFNNLESDGFNKCGLGSVIKNTLAYREWYLAKGSEIATPILEIIRCVHAKIKPIRWQNDIKPYIIDASMFLLKKSY